MGQWESASPVLDKWCKELMRKGSDEEEENERLMKRQTFQRGLWWANFTPFCTGLVVLIKQTTKLNQSSKKDAVRDASWWNDHLIDINSGFSLLPTKMPSIWCFLFYVCPHHCSLWMIVIGWANRQSLHKACLDRRTKPIRGRSNFRQSERRRKKCFPLGGENQVKTDINFVEDMQSKLEFSKVGKFSEWSTLLHCIRIHSRHTLIFDKIKLDSVYPVKLSAERENGITRVSEMIAAAAAASVRTR